MQFAILTLNDAGVGVLADGRILQRQSMTPVGAIFADGDRERRAHTLLRARERGEVVVDEHMTTILQGNGISATLVVGHIQKRNISPCVAIVAGEGSANLSVASAHQNLQASILEFQDGGLNAIDGVASVLGGYTSCIRGLAAVEALPAFMSSVRMANSALMGPTYFHSFLAMS